MKVNEINCENMKERELQGLQRENRKNIINLTLKK